MLVLARHGRPNRTFVFDCTQREGDLRGLWLRTCKLREDGRPIRVAARRIASRFPIEITNGGTIPRLFRSGGRLFGEVNWRVDAPGRPQPALRQLRFPIACFGAEARSGHSFDISAPFMPWRSRHDISNDDRNPDLVRRAREAFAYAGLLLGKAYGPGAGKLIRSSDPRSVDQEG